MIDDVGFATGEAAESQVRVLHQESFDYPCSFRGNSRGQLEPPPNDRLEEIGLVHSTAIKRRVATDHLVYQNPQTPVVSGAIMTTV